MTLCDVGLSFGSTSAGDITRKRPDTIECHPPGYKRGPTFLSAWCSQLMIVIQFQEVRVAMRGRSIKCDVIDNRYSFADA